MKVWLAWWVDDELLIGVANSRDVAMGMCEGFDFQSTRREKEWSWEPVFDSRVWNGTTGRRFYRVVEVEVHG